MSLKKFIRVSDALVQFEAKFNDISEDSHTPYTLAIHREELKELWEKVKLSYEDGLDALDGGSKTVKEDTALALNKYDVSYKAYFKCLSSINEKALKFEDDNKSCAFVNKSRNYTENNLTLPPCDVKTFEGDYISWPTFRDLFTAIYMNNSRLSNVERLCHLVRKTAGEANEIVSKCPLTNEGFDVAWQNLKKTYENPRMLVNNQLKLLFNIPSMDKESTAGLKLLQRGVNNCLTSLSIYKVCTTNWDPILIFICIQRLPTSTVSLWEQGVSNKTELSTWKDFDEFLTERIQTLECVRELKDSAQSTKPSGQKVKAHVVSASSTSCAFCRSPGHFLRSCQRFKNLSISQRFSNVKRLHCCVNCLSREHEVKNCKSPFNCNICNKRHNSLLHRSVSNSGSTDRDNSAVVAGNITQDTGANSSLPSTSSGIRSNDNSNRQVFHVSQNRKVLLGTAMVNIIHHGETYPARALIDPASESSFISENLQNRLKLLAHSTNVKISGINQTTSAITRKVCALKIGCIDDKSVQFETMALVLPNISGNLPSLVIGSSIRDQFVHVPLADPGFYRSGPVDLLLGADLYPRIILDEIQRDVLGSLVAQRTVFGWIITGSVPEPCVQAYTTTIEVSPEDSLNKNLLRFWELEETPKRKFLTPFDRFCEENYRRTTRRDSDGRYVVTLPFKPEFPHSIGLGISRQNVMAQFLRNESSLLRKPEIKQLYDQVVQDYINLDNMRPINNDFVDQNCCYLPHHPVIKPDSKTTKLRVVFNASNKTSNGTSLNNCLYVGPTLQSDLVLLILRWRLFKYVFNCDITQMYRQIRLDSAHTPFQRILFRASPTEEVKSYELQTVTFGVNCGPYLAIRTLLQLAEDSEAEYPLAVHILRKAMYVDDVITGAHDVSSALTARDQLITVLSSAKFELRKWTSNEIRILSGLPSDYLVDSKLLKFVESSSSKTLGIQWNAHVDSFYFRVEPIAKKPNYTKREVLSTIARLFDPVGWLGPIIITAKIIMQKGWQDSIDWDDVLLPLTAKEWQKFVAFYTDVNKIQIPRWVHYSPWSSAEIHVFSDASEKAYAGAVYIRVETFERIYTNLLSCKTRVAPLKSISLPRLELCGAVLASELLKTIVNEIGIPLKQVYCWTDSTIVLCWLRKTPSSWTTFVANRVCRIQENVGKHNWYHVKSEENPADLASRGLSPSELAANDLWWHGPTWLRQPKVDWNVKDLSPLETDIEARAVKKHMRRFTQDLRTF